MARSVDKVISAITSMKKDERRTLRDRALAWIADGATGKVADAKAVLDALDATEGEEREQLARHVEKLDNVQRVVEAFTKQPLTQHERRVVQLLLDNPGLTSEALTRAAGWREQAWHMHFVGLCRDRGHLLWPAPYEEKRSADFYSGILANYDRHTHGFTMKPEAGEGFRRIGLTPKGAS